jgi:hypothetical protein
LKLFVPKQSSNRDGIHFLLLALELEPMSGYLRFTAARTWAATGLPDERAKALAA